MNQLHQCPECHTQLPADSPDGLCPACLLKRGLETDTVGFTEEGKPASKYWEPLGTEDLASHFPDLDQITLIGRGGMGAVYKARQKSLDRITALKILPPEIGRDPDFAQRFAREAQAMAKLSHANIVAIHDFGQRDGLFYFLMEYVDGLNLRQVLNNGNISPAEALAIVPQICDALQYAHDRGIVHRDIKPENILMDKQGQVKIADFGLAKLVGLTRPADTHESDDQPSTPSSGDGVEDLAVTSGKIIGTPQYMAPEQINDPTHVDHRADIYALGVVFYQMLTGELPRNDQFIPPSRKVQIDVRLDEVVLRALAREPNQRYQQVTDVKTSVQTIISEPHQKHLNIDAELDFGKGHQWQYKRSIPVGDTENIPTPKLSKMAVTGAIALALPWLFIALVVFLYSMRTAIPSTSTWNNFKSVSILSLIVSIGCGLIALGQIRHSEGRLYGRRLAWLDVLFYPLLAMNFVVVLLGDMANDYLLLWIHRYNWTGGFFYYLIQDKFIFLIAFVLIAWIDWKIFRRINRSMQTANADSSSDAASSELSLSNRKSSMTKIGLVTVLIIAMLAIFSTYPKVQIVETVTQRRHVGVDHRRANPYPDEELNAIYQKLVDDVEQSGIKRKTPSRVPKFLEMSNLVVHDQVHLHYVLVSNMDFTNSEVRASYNSHSLVWIDNGSVTLKNGRTFGYLRESVSPVNLTINGKEYDLRNGRVIGLLEDGTTVQIKLFPTIEQAQNKKKLLAEMDQLYLSCQEPITQEKLQYQLQATENQLKDMIANRYGEHDPLFEATVKNISALQKQIRQMIDVQLYQREGTILAKDVQLHFADPTKRDGSFHTSYSVSFLINLIKVKDLPALMDIIQIGNNIYSIFHQDEVLTFNVGDPSKAYKTFPWKKDGTDIFEKVLTIPAVINGKTFQVPVHFKLHPISQASDRPIGSYWYSAYLSGILQTNDGPHQFEIVNLDRAMKFRNSPINESMEDAVFGIDLNGDGKITKDEAIGDLYTPFQIGKETFRLASVDPIRPLVIFRKVEQSPSVEQSLGDTDIEHVHAPLPKDTDIVERTIHFKNNDCLYDLDTGKFVQLDEKFGSMDYASRIGWLKEQGVDIGGGNGLVGFDFVNMPVENVAWDRPDSVTSNAANLMLMLPGNPVYLEPNGKLPATYLFKTREGRVGILQILEIKSDDYTKIRYRIMDMPKLDIQMIDPVEAQRWEPKPMPNALH